MLLIKLSHPREMKKYLTAFILFVTASVACSGLGDLRSAFFKTEDWSFIQSVGGMEVSLEGQELHVDCDVSGVRKVTVEPTMIHSALSVRKLKVMRVGNTIQLRLATGVVIKKVLRTPKPVDLSDYPAGEYSVEYLDSDGTTHPLGKVNLKKNKEGEKPEKR